jgi:cytochrome c-type biogenesis protein CcmH/NrfF
MIARAAAVSLLALLLAGPGAAATKRPTLAQLEHEVMCPTCHTLLELSNAPIADRMRAFIRRRIAAGDSDGEIKRRLVAQFGEGVLAAPPGHGFGLVAWLIPVGGFLSVGAIIGVTLRHWRRDHDLEWAGVRDSRGPLDPELARRVDRELAELDG